MEFIKNGRITGSMCDASTELSVLGLIQLEEDAVTELMGDLHIDGITAINKYNAMWVFVRNAIKIFRRPAWREEYELRCFVSDHSAARLILDTEVRSTSTNEPLAHARLELCALDITSGRVRKASTVGVSKDIPCGEPLSGLSFEQFPMEGFKTVESVTVRSTTQDYCFHTNNIEYFRFILNTYKAKRLLEKEIEMIEIHYLNQTFEDDQILITLYEKGDIDYFSLICDEEHAVDCKIKWK